MSHQDRFSNLWVSVSCSNLRHKLEASLGKEPQLLFVRYDLEKKRYYCLQEIRPVYITIDSDVRNFEKVNARETGVRLITDGRISPTTDVYIPLFPRPNFEKARDFAKDEHEWPKPEVAAASSSKRKRM